MLHLKDNQLEGTPCRSRACVQFLCAQLVDLKLVTVIVESCFNIRVVRLTPLKNEAVAVLHAMRRLESIVCFFIGVLEKI